LFDVILLCCIIVYVLLFFFFIDPSTSEIYTLSLHDALPIYLIQQNQSLLAEYRVHSLDFGLDFGRQFGNWGEIRSGVNCRPKSRDRKSTRLNSSHVSISYAVFCLKKKKNNRRCIYKKPYHIQ